MKKDENVPENNKGMKQRFRTEQLISEEEKTM
jgi:hypothetical protein